MEITFGSFLKEKRIAKSLLLRECALELKENPSHWSEYEREMRPSPTDISTLFAWATFLGLTPSERGEFYALAVKSQSQPKVIEIKDETLPDSIVGYSPAIPEIDRLKLQSQGYYFLWKSSECLIGHAKSEQATAYRHRDRAKVHIKAAAKIIEDILSSESLVSEAVKQEFKVRLKQLKEDAEID